MKLQISILIAFVFIGNKIDDLFTKSLAPPFPLSEYLFATTLLLNFYVLKMVLLSLLIFISSRYNDVTIMEKYPATYTGEVSMVSGNEYQ